MPELQKMIHTINQGSDHFISDANNITAHIKSLEIEQMVTKKVPVLFTKEDIIL